VDGGNFLQPKFSLALTKFGNIMSYLWVLTVQFGPFGHGSWKTRELWDLIRNQVGGQENSWGFTDYGLSQPWVKTESTVLVGVNSNLKTVAPKYRELLYLGAFRSHA
jgi:hypothetical protein